jgi:hypothetical protein
VEHASFVNGSRGFGIYMAGKTTRYTEPGYQLVQTGTITSVLGHESGERILKPETREDGWSAMTCRTESARTLKKRREPTWADDIECVEIGFADEPVHVRIYERKTGACTPMTEKTRFDISMRQLVFK